MTSHHTTDALLRSMDAAQEAPPVNAHRARADLDRILSQNPSASRFYLPSAAADADQKRATSRSRGLRRSIAVGGLVAAATAGLMIVPALTTGDPAFATWTAVPMQLTGSDWDGAVAECRSAQGGRGDGPADTAEVAIAEQRGAWNTVVLTGPDSFEATCITDASALIRGGSMVGSTGTLGSDTDPAPRGLKPTHLGVPYISSTPLSMASGRAGSDVAGITYTSIDGDEVIATVSKGHFAFWLPGDEFAGTVETGVPVRVTYADGTIETQTLDF